MYHVCIMSVSKHVCIRILSGDVNQCSKRSYILFTMLTAVLMLLVNKWNYSLNLSRHCARLNWLQLQHLPPLRAHCTKDAQSTLRRASVYHQSEPWWASSRPLANLMQTNFPVWLRTALHRAGSTCNQTLILSRRSNDRCWRCPLDVAFK